MKNLIVITVMLFAVSGPLLAQIQGDNVMNETLKTIFERRSVRSHVEGKEIPKETLELIVRAGMAAPTGKNVQPWEFIVLEDKKIMLELAEALPYAKMLKTASAAIIVCGYPETSSNPRASQNWMLDCAAASQNILLAVQSLGLGAVWTAGWPYADRIDAIRKAVSLPDDIMPLNVIPIGYPSGKDQPKDKFNSERIHWNKW